MKKGLIIVIALAALVLLVVTTCTATVETGYTGIVIAYLAGLNPLMVVVAAILFGALQISAVAVQISGVPSQIATMIQGSIMLFVIAGDFFNRYRLVRPGKEAPAAQKGGDPS